jgi:hypothetical protein
VPLFFAPTSLVYSKLSAPMARTKAGRNARKSGASIGPSPPLPSIPTRQYPLAPFDPPANASKSRKSRKKKVDLDEAADDDDEARDGDDPRRFPWYTATREKGTKESKLEDLMKRARTGKTANPKGVMVLPYDITENDICRVLGLTEYEAAP